MSLLVSWFNTGAYVVSRITPQAPTNGITPPGTVTSTFTIYASVQPLTGRALEDLPLGQRAEDMRWVYTDSLLRTRGPAQEPDIIAVDDATYRVNKVEHFKVLSGHYRATVERIEVP